MVNFLLYQNKVSLPNLVATLESTIKYENKDIQRELSDNFIVNA